MARARSHLLLRTVDRRQRRGEFKDDGPEAAVEQATQSCEHSKLSWKTQAAADKEEQEWAVAAKRCGPCGCQGADAKWPKVVAG